MFNLTLVFVLLFQTTDPFAALEKMLMKNAPALAERDAAFKQLKAAVESGIGDPIKAKKVSDILLAEYGVYVQPINYPTVPRGTERLRFTPGPTHSEAMMRELTQALVEIWSRMEMKLAA